MTDKLKQAAQQALECIERLNAHGWILADYEDGVYAAITALKAALEQQEPSVWRDMVVVSLVREGVNKHRARELADYFAAERPWQGLAPADFEKLEQFFGSKVSNDFVFSDIICTVEAKLKEKQNE